VATGRRRGKTGGKEFSDQHAGAVGLADWLREVGCTQVAMEATGVYWKPVWHVLEGEFELVLANADARAT